MSFRFHSTAAVNAKLLQSVYQMVKLEFSNEVAEIVSGLTRVKPDKKLTIPESIEAVFNKQYSSKNDILARILDASILFILSKILFCYLSNYSFELSKLSTLLKIFF